MWLSIPLHDYAVIPGFGIPLVDWGGVREHVAHLSFEIPWVNQLLFSQFLRILLCPIGGQIPIWRVVFPERAPIHWSIVIISPEIMSWSLWSTDQLIYLVCWFVDLFLTIGASTLWLHLRSSFWFNLKYIWLFLFQPISHKAMCTVNR